MPPYDIFELHFTLGQVYYVTGDRENAKKTLLKWVEIGEKINLISSLKVTQYLQPYMPKTKSGAMLLNLLH